MKFIKKLLKISIKIFFWLILAGIIGLILLVLRYGSEMPDYKALASYAPPVATRLYASDGSLLIEYANERRVFIDYEDLPPMLINAFVAAEDQHFWNHPGIDPIGLARAMVGNFARIVLGRGNQLSGASTITQQVAKNFFLSNEQTFARKIREAILALRLERTFSKKHIMTLYMNQIFLGARAFGVGAASLMYFNKPVKELTLSEAAFLAALPKAPNNRARAMERRGYVLRRMLEERYITDEQFNQAMAEEVILTDEFVGQQSADSQYFAEEVRRLLLRELGRDTLYNGGLYIKTTIVPRLQDAAATALKSELDKYNVNIKNPDAPRLQGAIMAINPHTGRVLAMSGGYSFKESSFNRATQARRQVGSTIKTFLYLFALEQSDKFSPVTLLLDAPIVGWIEDGSNWKPENHDREFMGEIPLRFSLETSRNVTTVRLVQALGVHRTIRSLQRFGIYGTRLANVNLSMTLGSGESTLQRMVMGHAALINGGFLRTPKYVDYIQDRHGRLVVGGAPDLNHTDVLPPGRTETSEPLSDPQSLYQIVSILQGAVERGTGRQARVPGHTIAGKTGTTNEIRDVWFIGFSKNLTVGVFLGFDEPQPLGPGSGSFMPARVFSDFMKVALEGEANQPFSVPDGLEFRRVNRRNGKSASDSPDGMIINEVFKHGQYPNSRRLGSSAAIDMESGGTGDLHTPSAAEMGGIF